MVYEDCGSSPSIIVNYAWAPDEPDWLALHPGEGETSLRYVALEGLETLRVHIVEPCRELEVEYDGRIDAWSPFFPGKACWVHPDRCFPPDSTHLDYCEGEEPPPCP
jgi:hypothetical protein